MPTRAAKNAKNKPTADLANIKLDKTKVDYHVNKMSESVEKEEVIKGDLSLDSPKVKNS